jgi:hypothetical protein
MNRIKLFGLSVLICLAPSFPEAQTNPIIKIELQAGLGLATAAFTPCLPALYFPINKHLDLGISYNFIETRYGNFDTIGQGSVNHNFPSFFIKLNGGNSMSRFNPFIGYIFSLVKGKHSWNPNGGGELYGYTPYFSMTGPETAILEEALEKRRIAHGIQAGCELRITSGTSFFLKTELFRISGDSFPFHYTENTFSYNKQLYGFGGFLFKIYAKTKKSLIK